MTQRTLKKNLINYVIDTSICGMDFFDTIFENLYQNLGDNKFILTSVVIRELDQLQKYDDLPAKNAKFILKLAAIDEFHFKEIFIDEFLSSMDDCIISFCHKNADNVVLLTSDKYMTLKARMFGVNVQYYEHYIPQIEHDDVKKVSFFDVYKEDDKLLLSNFYTDSRQVKVIRGEMEFEDGVVELKVNDEIYLATKKSNYVTFAHYKVINTNNIDNCQLLFARRVYNKKEISNLKYVGYKVFLRSFLRRVGTNLEYRSL